MTNPLLIEVHGLGHSLSVRVPSCAVVLAVLGIASCSAQQPAPHPSPTGALTSPSDPSSAASDVQRLDMQRLNELAESRSRDRVSSSGSDFALGPGDVLHISVPLEELEDREVRVSPQNTITLPMIGEMSVKSMTEDELTRALQQRLSRYMHNPPVVLFVKHYGSREVAVTGAVDRPGLYTLNSRSDTLMEMISRAGGKTNDAAARVIFVPEAANADDVALLGTGAYDGGKGSTNSGNHQDGGHLSRAGVRKVAATQPDPPDPGQTSAFDALTTTLNPIVIDTNNRRMLAYLNMPARPGDVLIIPAAGEVTVDGWVLTPGAYRIVPGMTALSAVSAAGGALFSSSGQVLRTGPDGERASFPFSISEIRKGQQSDVPVQSGDVVMVNRSVIGAVPYGAYQLFTKFGTGMYVPIP